MNRRQSLTLLLGSAAIAAAGAPTLAFAQAQPAAPEGPFKLPPLGYAIEALEPHIDAQTMMIHHDRHHAAFISANNFAKRGRSPPRRSKRSCRSGPRRKQSSKA